MPGDRWMIRGPLEYVPPVEVEVAAKRKAIPLDENEGIYVRDIKTGKVRRNNNINIIAMNCGCVNTSTRPCLVYDHKIFFHGIMISIVV